MLYTPRACLLCRVRLDLGVVVGGRRKWAEPSFVVWGDEDEDDDDGSVSTGWSVAGEEQGVATDR